MKILSKADIRTYANQIENTCFDGASFDVDRCYRILCEMVKDIEEAAFYE